MTTIYIDGDACSVKDETYKVARRYKIPVVVVSNAWMNTPDDPLIELMRVGDGFDEADDWIVDHATSADIVITADIPLAARCVENGARVLGQKGREFTPENVGDALASREVSAQLREHGLMTGGPAPFSDKDRSNYLQKLDQLVQAALRE